MAAKNEADSKFFRRKGAIAWMAGHSVTANLLMAVLVVGGLAMGFRIKQEFLPEAQPEVVRVSVGYPGASPEEVEEGIILPIEEALEGIDGIEEVISNSNEGSGSVRAEIADGEDLQEVNTNIKNAIDRIITFPDEAEEPTVALESRKRQVVELVIYGDHSEWTLREAAEVIRDRILQSPDITQVELIGARDYEVTIEVDRQTLRQYGLTLGAIASRIRTAAVDLPGGGLKTSGGEILVRVTEKRDWAKEFETIPIITKPDGSRVYLGDVATVKDYFEDSDRLARFGKFVSEDGVSTEVDLTRALRIDVYRIGEQTPITVSDAVIEAVEELQQTLPAGINIDLLNNRADRFRARAELLLRNAAIGLVLVISILGIFLEARLAFWVMLGIPISFLGCFLIMPLFGATINMVSMFAFIITLGIVVDDAIVVGENIYSHQQRGAPFWKAAVTGTREVMMPVTFSVMTNIVAFMPLMFVPGMMGKLFRVMPLVVVSVFAVSLVESLFILPAHLSHHKDNHPKGLGVHLHRFQQSFRHWFTRIVTEKYGPLIARLVSWRYVVIAGGIFILLGTVGYVKSGRIRVVQIERPDADVAYAEANLPFGSPVEDTIEISKAFSRTALEVVREHGGTDLATGIFVDVGRKGGGHSFSVTVYLTDPDLRPISTEQFTRQWRQKVGALAGLDTMRFQADRGGAGGASKGITIELSHRDINTLDAAGSRLAGALREFPQVKDVDDGFQPGKEQLDLSIKPEGQALGLTARDIANQVRHSFYGAEALRQLRGRNEVKTMVRLPREQRVSEFDIDNLVLLTPTRGEVPLVEAVDVKRGRAYTSIERNNGRRVVEVSAETANQGDAGPIISRLKSETMPALMAEFPGLTWEFEGRQAEMKESIDSLVAGLLIALFCIYALLAIPFNSYYQPLIIMMAIPFGLVGAVIGHVIMGYNISLLSLFGIVALSGVVVNDSLVLIDFANRRRRGGMSGADAIREAGVARFRAIVLTTLTTFGGLAPMILETSRQARFMIPMAISLGFGILFSTFIVLILVPCFYVILEDAAGFLRGGEEEDGE